ncbi:MAG: hypothetical protein SFV15_24250 [Polyangiaceae bacterium]|nr:hypothetical protein [Polyangiaceae bacterium]
MLALLLGPACRPDSQQTLPVAPASASAVAPGVRVANTANTANTAPARSPSPAPGPVRRPTQKPPKRVLFVGNSFVHSGPLPEVLGLLVKSAQISDVSLEMSAESGWSLADHRKSQATLASLDKPGWDVVVLQDQSTRPTAKMGKPEEFRDDALWLIERLRQKSPKARVVLFQTWAQHPSAWVYQEHYKDFASMTEDLRRGYVGVVEAYVRKFGTEEPQLVPALARVGDAWERYLAQPGALRLHGQDGVHPSDAGKYLNALVFFRVLYQRPTAKLVGWTLPQADAAALQALADSLPDE